MEVKERQHFLDVLRVAAACAVVLLHTVTGIRDISDMSQYPAEDRIFLVLMDLACWCVPIFIMISGYLFLDPERELTFGQMSVKYCRRILLALFLFGVPYAWMELWMTQGTFQWGILPQGVVMVVQGRSWAHMWYLYLIFFLYLLTPAIKWLLAKLPRRAVCVLAAALFVSSAMLPFGKEVQWLPETLWTLSGNSIYLFYYICGYLFATWKKPARWLAPLFPLTAGLLALGMAGSRLAGNFLVMGYNYPFTALLALSLFAWGLTGERESGRTQSAQNTGFWSAASALSFGIYLIHPVFLNLFYKYFNVTPLSFFIGLSLPLFFLGTLLLSALTSWLLRKLPPLRRYVL